MGISDLRSFDERMQALGLAILTQMKQQNVNEWRIPLTRENMDLIRLRSDGSQSAVEMFIDDRQDCLVVRAIVRKGKDNG